MVKVKCFDNKNKSHYVEIEKSQLSKCRVCGYDFINWFPWGETGLDPTFGICPCCGVEFGYEDSSIEGITSHRKRWLSKGAIIFNLSEIKCSFDLEESLKNLPKVFRKES